MNIAYIVNARIPTEKAHGLQIVRVCDALARLGHSVRLVVPNRKNDITTDAFSYYGLTKSFDIEQLPVIDRGFRIQAVSFLWSLFSLKISKDTAIITRNPEIAFLFTCRGLKVYYYAHNWPQSKVSLFIFLLRGVAGIICNSRGTEEEFGKNGFRNTLVVPNAVDMSAFESLAGKDELRNKHDIPADKKIVMYVGHLYTWKGVDVVIDAARALKQKNDILFYIVGGTKEDIEKYRSIISRDGLSNVILVGHKKHQEVPSYLKSADILLLPNVPSSKESERYTSPIKMFEYMASGVPIIASDMPSIREVLNDGNATLVKAGDTQALADAVGNIASNPSAGQHKASTAQVEARGYSWDALARKISQWIGTSAQDAVR